MEIDLKLCSLQTSLPAEVFVNDNVCISFNLSSSERRHMSHGCQPLDFGRNQFLLLKCVWEWEARLHSLVTSIADVSMVSRQIEVESEDSV